MRWSCSRPAITPLLTASGHAMLPRCCNLFNAPAPCWASPAGRVADSPGARLFDLGQAPCGNAGVSPASSVLLRMRDPGGSSRRLYRHGTLLPLTVGDNSPQ